MPEVNLLPISARFNVARSRKIGGAPPPLCNVETKGAGFHWGPSQQHNGVLLPRTVYLEVLCGSINPSSTAVATPRGRQVGAPDTATTALPVDTVESGESLRCVFKQSDTGHVVAYVRGK